MQAAALIQQNTANPLQHYDFFFPKAQPLVMHFTLFFWYGSYLARHTVDCSGVRVALVKPEQDQPVEAEEECKTPGNKNSLFYILHVN